MGDNKGKLITVPLNLYNIPAVTAIERSCFSEPWSENAFIQELSSSSTYFRVAMINSEVVGYIGMYCVCREGYITNLAVKEEFRGQGIATSILKECISYAIKKNFELLSLEVRVSNTAAIRLYTSMGFRKEGRRKDFYKSPVEDAWIMTRYVRKGDVKDGV